MENRKILNYIVKSSETMRKKADSPGIRGEEKKRNKEKLHQGGWQHSYSLKQHLTTYSFSIRAPMTSIDHFVDVTLPVESLFKNKGAERIT